jgi:hypothetical protein
MPAIDGPSRVTMTDQLGQRVDITVYTPEQWAALPWADHKPLSAVTVDGRYVVTLTDAPVRSRA